MKDLVWLFSFYFTQIRNRITTPTRESFVKYGLVILFAAFFFPIVYQLFYFIFKHFYSVPLVGPLMVNKLLYTFYLTFSVMIILSSIISAIPVLYLSRDMDFLFSSPVKIETIFAGQALKIITGASWMILLMSVPVFGAYAAVVKITAGQFFFILLAHIPYFTVLASAGIVVTILLVRFFPAENVRNIAIAFSGIFAAAMIVYFRMLQPEKLTGAGFNQVNEMINNLRTPDAPWLPHAQLVRIVIRTTANGVYDGLGPFLIYASVAAAVLALVLASSKYLYFEGYGRKGSYRKQRPLPPDYEYSRSFVLSAQMSKDLKYLVRDTSQWIQVVFLCGIVFIYLFNLYKLPAELFGLKDFIFFLNIGFIGMVLSAVGARFMLPVISSEGRGFWMYKTAPITMERYVLYKFLAYCAPIILVGQAVAAASILMLKPGPFVAVLTLYSTFFITIVIASAGMGFGGFFANFTIKNPEELITGIGGLTYMFVSFIYTAMVLVIEAGMVKDYYMSKLVKARLFIPAHYVINFVAVLVLAVIISVPALWAGINKLKKMEI